MQNKYTKDFTYDKKITSDFQLKSLIFDRKRDYLSLLDSLIDLVPMFKFYLAAS